MSKGRLESFPSSGDVLGNSALEPACEEEDEGLFFSFFFVYSVFYLMMVVHSLTKKACGIVT